MNAYYPNVKGAYLNQTNQYVYFPCASKLPNFSLYINGHKATVPGSYLNAGQVSATTCFGGMQAEGHVGANIIGDQFLKSQFVVFDMNGPTLGFAQQKVPLPLQAAKGPAWPRPGPARMWRESSIC